MNCKKSFISLILIILTAVSFWGCSAKIEVNTNQTAETYIEAEDYQNFLDIYSNCAKTQDGYYFISNAHLYFYDTDTKEATLACNKVNCEHNDDSCTAYFQMMNFFPLQLSYYDNALYVLGWENEGANIHRNYIYQIFLDDFKRKKAVYIGNSNGLTNTIFLIHRGYVYYSTGTDSMSKIDAVIYRKKLGNTDKKDTGEIVFKYNGIGAQISDIKASTNNLFISVSDYENENGDGYSQLYNCVNIHTLEVKKIIGDYVYAEFPDGKFVYFEKDENTVNRLDINTGEEEFFCNINGPCYILADSNYIYFDNLQKMYIDENFKDRKIFVYDKKGNFVTEFVPKNPKDDCCFGGDDVMIFREIIQGEAVESNGAEGYYVLDKSQLTSPDKEFIDMK